MRIRTWPGPIVQLIVGEIDEEAVENECRARDDQQTRERELLAEFYKTLIEIAPGTTAFKDSMRKLSDVSQPEWRDENAFVSRIWNEEYFLARHEAL